MGYRLNRLEEPVLIAVLNTLLTEFGMDHRLESCVGSPSLTLHSFVFLDDRHNHRRAIRKKETTY